MDFLRNNEERAIVDKVRQVAQKYIAPRIQAADEDEYVASENLAVLFRQGLMGLAVQEEYGGLGCNLRGNILVETRAVEEIACVCSRTSRWFHDHNEALGVIYSLGTPEQQRRFSRATLDACTQFSGWSSELGALPFNAHTTAHRVAGGYIINGAKNCPTGSEGATWRLIIARGADLPDTRGIIFALIHRHNPGAHLYFKQNNERQYRRTDSTIVYTDCFVPDEDILGSPGVRDELSWWRPFSHLGWAALYAGLARGAFKVGRKQMRAVKCPWAEKPIEREPYSRWYLAEMSARIEIVSHLFYTAAVALEKAQRRIDSRVEAAKAAYHAKVFAVETALAVTSYFLPVRKTPISAEWCALDSYWCDTWAFVLQDSAAYE